MSAPDPRLHDGYRLLERLGVDDVVDVAPMTEALDEARLLEHRHVLGHGRLRDAERQGKRARAVVLVEQQLQNLEPHRFRNYLELFTEFLVCLVHVYLLAGTSLAATIVGPHAYLVPKILSPASPRPGVM